MKVVKSILVVVALVVLAPIAFVIYPFLEEEENDDSK